MFIGLVTGNVTSTRKVSSLEGRKLMLVQPLDLYDDAVGEEIIAVDLVDAGIGDKAIVNVEGRSAGEALGVKNASVDAIIVGVVDRVDLVRE